MERDVEMLEKQDRLRMQQKVKQIEEAEDVSNKPINEAKLVSALADGVCVLVVCVFFGNVCMCFLTELSVCQ